MTYSDSELLDALRALGEALDDQPTASDVRDRDDLPSVPTFSRRFGSWTDALEAAGFETGPITRDDCIDLIQDLADELDRVPTVDDVNEADDMPHMWTFQDRFGSWSAAVEAAGFEPNPGTPIDEEALLDTLESLTRDLGRPPSEQDMDEEGPYSAFAYRRHFGSWDEALAAINLLPAPPRNRTSDRELIEDLRSFANVGGPGRTFTPTKRDMDDRGPHSYDLYQERFGSWAAALVEAGLDPRQTITPEAIIEEIRRVAAEVGLNPDGGPAPTVADLAEYGELSLHTVQREFDTWNEAVMVAGFIPNEGRPAYTDTYSDMEIVQEIRRVADHLNETPTASQFAELGAVGTSTIERRLGSWNRALKLAGLRPRRQSPGGTPRGMSDAVDIDRSPGTPTDPRIDQIRVDADDTPHVLAVGDVIVDTVSPLETYRVLLIEAKNAALTPEWQVITQPIAIDRPHTRTFYGDELVERLSSRDFWIQSAAE